MVLDKDTILEKLKERIQTSGKYHRRGLEKAPNPIEIALKNLDLMKQRLLKAFEEGRVEAGFKRALQEGKWEKRIDIASKRWEESADYIVEEYAKVVDDVIKCAEEALKACENMPRVTRQQRIQYGACVQEAIGKCWDKIKGLSTK